MQSSLKGRTFVVGCARSGTTLLESLLGAHPRIKGFPETAFLLFLVGQWNARALGRQSISKKEQIGGLVSSVRVRLGITHETGSANIQDFAKKINRPDLLSLYPDHSYSLKRQVDAWVNVLDTLTIEDGKDYWIEKSPKHLGFIDVIERYIPDVKIIHIVRSGADVVASLTDASQKYAEHPNSDWYRYASLDYCITRWNHCMRVTMANKHKPNHFVVSYEQLVENNLAVLQELCRFLEVEYDDRMLTNYHSVAEKISTGEPWKSNTSTGIYNANSTKFYEIFDDAKRAYIMENLMEVDIDSLLSVKNSIKNARVEITQ